jgi:hypothetical protein
MVDGEQRWHTIGAVRKVFLLCLDKSSPILADPLDILKPPI